MAAPSRYARSKALFDALVDLSDAAAQWQALQAADADDALRNDVWALLQAHRQTTRIGAPIAAASRAWQPPAEPLKPGDRLGPWVLRGDLGEGGMGRVMRAERADGAYDQQVAIKLLRGLADADALARLTRERQILAGLRHPHIARLLDGGSTPAGQPYLVMELVDGQPIDRWCDARGADLATRLALFDQVGDAVAHAHARLVVHCDIKPSNVLVDADGQVRLLDFGIARLTQGDSPDMQPALTPAYASPEQLAGATPGTASDIYSLGRLLQRLLADVPTGGLRGQALQAVLARAQAAEPARRYTTVGELRADLHRLQQARPVQAWPPGPARRRYVAALALRRHWLVLLAAAGALAMAGAFTWGLAQQRENARREAEAAQQISRFVIRLFEGADSENGGLRAADTPVRLLLDRGHAQLQRELQDQPAQRARLLDVLGTVYENIGQLDAAASAYREAIALEAAAGPDRRAQEAALQYKLAFTLNRQGHYEAAAAAAGRCLALREALADVPPAELADAHNAAGMTLSNLGRTAAARPHLDRALALRRAQFGDAHNQVAQLHNNLALWALAAGRPRDAEAQARQAVAIGQALPALPGLHHRRLTVLAMALMAQGRLDEAEPLLAQALAQARARYGADATYLHRVLRELGLLQARRGQWPAAAATYREALAAADQGGDTGNPVHALTLSRLADALAALGDAAGAEAAHRQALTGLRGAGDPLGEADAQAAYARWLQARGRDADARPLLQAAQDTRQRLLPADHPLRRTPADTP
ncbi:tetratricopeptide repeat protein [Roseateles sp. DXS20W]|uniref:Tetratricopeptide repeat protein n=1 Tax=Pelomonas lactea TaxID=3299030 RepID=A0ABW7GJW9_9BURK